MFSNKTYAVGLESGAWHLRASLKIDRTLETLRVSETISKKELYRPPETSVYEAVWRNP
jgi:hypothetical protein